MTHDNNNILCNMLKKILKNTKLFWGLMIIQTMEMVDDKREI